eukprot:jgi/Mesvir1/5719/Mv09822-RA.1
MQLKLRLERAIGTAAMAAPDRNKESVTKESSGSQQAIPRINFRHESVIWISIGTVYLALIVIIIFIWLHYTTIVNTAASELSREARDGHLSTVRELLLLYFHDFRSTMEYLRHLVTTSDVAGDPFQPHWLDHMRAATWALMSAFPAGAGRLGVTWETGALSYRRFVGSSHLELKVSYVVNPRRVIVYGWMVPISSTWHHCVPEQCMCADMVPRSEKNYGYTDRGNACGGAPDLPSNLSQPLGETVGSITDERGQPVLQTPPLTWNEGCVPAPGCYLTVASNEVWSRGYEPSGSGGEAQAGVTDSDGVMESALPIDAPPPPPSAPDHHYVTMSSGASCLLPPPNFTMVETVSFFDVPWVRMLVRYGGNLLTTTANDGDAADRYGVNAYLMTPAKVPATRFGRAGPKETVLGVSFSTTALSKQLSDFTQDCGHGAGQETRRNGQFFAYACGSRMFVLDLDGMLIAASHGKVRTASSKLPGASSEDAAIRFASAALVGRYGPAPMSAGTLAAAGASISVDHLKLNGTVQLIDALLTQIEGTHFVLVVVTPESTSLARLDSTDRLYFTLLLVMLLLVFVLAALLMGRLMRKLVLERTLRKELLESKVEAEAACQAKGLFLANMSHEMRTPLTAVQGFLDLLINEYGSAQHSASAMEYATFARTSASMLLHVVNDVLDLEKMRNGHFDLEAVPVDLQELLESVVNLFAMKLFPHVEIVLTMTDRCPRFVVGDAFRIKQVFMNLLSNSVRFTRSGHIAVSLDAAPAQPKKPVANGSGKGHAGPHRPLTLTVRQYKGPCGRILGGPLRWLSSCCAGRMSSIRWLCSGKGRIPASKGGSHFSLPSSVVVHPAVGPRDSSAHGLLPVSPHGSGGAQLGEELQLLIAVEDTGTGLPQEKWESVFEDFVQADASTTRTHGGTGLGLSIVRRIVHKMGGDIHFVHKDGPGARVELTLAVRVAQDQEAAWMAVVRQGLAAAPLGVAMGHAEAKAIEVEAGHDGKGEGSLWRSHLVSDFFKGVLASPVTDPRVSVLSPASPADPVIPGKGRGLPVHGQPAAATSARLHGSTLGRYFSSAIGGCLPQRLRISCQDPSTTLVDSPTVAPLLLDGGKGVSDGDRQCLNPGAGGTNPTLELPSAVASIGNVGSGPDGHAATREKDLAQVTLNILPLFPHVNSNPIQGGGMAGCPPSSGFGGVVSQGRHHPGGKSGAAPPPVTCADAIHHHAGRDDESLLSLVLHPDVTPGATETHGDPEATDFTRRLTCQTSFLCNGGSKPATEATDHALQGNGHVAATSGVLLASGSQGSGRGVTRPDRVLLALVGPAERDSVSRWLRTKGLLVVEAGSSVELDALLPSQLGVGGGVGMWGAMPASGLIATTCGPALVEPTPCMNGTNAGEDSHLLANGSGPSQFVGDPRLPCHALSPRGEAAGGALWSAAEGFDPAQAARVCRRDALCDRGPGEGDGGGIRPQGSEDAPRGPMGDGKWQQDRLRGGREQDYGAVEGDQDYLMAIIDTAFLAPSPGLALRIPPSPPSVVLTGTEFDLDSSDDPLSTSLDLLDLPRGGSTMGSGEPSCGSCGSRVGRQSGDGMWNSGHDGYQHTEFNGSRRTTGMSDNGPVSSLAPPKYLVMEDIVKRLPVGCPLVWVMGASSKNLKDCIRRVSRMAPESLVAWERSRMACMRHPLHPWRLLALLASATAISATPGVHCDRPRVDPFNNAAEEGDGATSGEVSSLGADAAQGKDNGGGSGWTASGGTEDLPFAMVEFKSASHLFNKFAPVPAGPFARMCSSQGSFSYTSASSVGMAAPLETSAQNGVDTTAQKGVDSSAHEGQPGPQYVPADSDGGKGAELGSPLGSATVRGMGGGGGGGDSAGGNMPLWSAAVTPVQGAPATVTASASGGGNPLASAKILVAEDNKFNQVLLKHVLTKLGVTDFLLVSNGQLAVDALATNAWSCVLMDCNMPVMDGYTATRRIRELETSLGRLHVPIIALSANTVEEAQTKCLQAGMSGYLPKPVDITKLQDIITACMRGSFQPPPHPLNSLAQTNINANKR